MTLGESRHEVLCLSDCLGFGYPWQLFSGTGMGTHTGTNQGAND